MDRNNGEKTSQLIKQGLFFPLIVFFRNEVLLLQSLQGRETIIDT